MGRRGQQRLRALIDDVARLYPEIEDPDAAIRAGQIFVNGQMKRNPRTLVRGDSVVLLRLRQPLRGELKLGAALSTFEVPVSGRIALDVGASAGGFTRALLETGARRIYAVDAGHGQLLGSLRQDPRVVNLERTNLGELSRDLVPEVVELVTLDLSYLSATTAVRQLDQLLISSAAALVALVKPMFELHAASPPSDPRALEVALGHATNGIEAAGWRVQGTMQSPIKGARGAIEFFVHAIRS